MTTRQEIYDRIRETSKDEYILEEMVRLGFWPRNGQMPEDPADEFRRRGELERQLRALTTENNRLQNAEAIKKALRKQRMKESRQKRKETKERRLRERQERAAAWRRRKETEIVYLGEGVSAGLSHRESDETKLNRYGLPIFRSAEDVAAAMEISVCELRFLAFRRRTSQVTHYRRFAIKKKTGGLRHISAPMPRLKRAQHWILAQILKKVELHPAAHGFRRGRSIVSNARPHVGSDVVINADVQNFFPTVTFPRIKGVFRSLGYSESVATIFALLCSEPETSEVRLDGETYHVAKGERFLPQGAPTSPAITNIMCRGMDARLSHAAEQLGFRYTRYADDVTFSGSNGAQQNVGRALRRIRYVVAEEGFQLHPDKTRVLHSGARQEVTGLTVNQRVNVSRKVLRRFRATLFQIDRDGPAGKRWGNGDDVLASIEGFANFVAMVDPDRGVGLQQRVKQIVARYGPARRVYVQRSRWTPPAPPPVEIPMIEPVAEATPARSTSPAAIEIREQSSRRRTKKTPWWKFW